MLLPNHDLSYDCSISPFTSRHQTICSLTILSKVFIIWEREVRGLYSLRSVLGPQFLISDIQRSLSIFEICVSTLAQNVHIGQLSGTDIISWISALETRLVTVVLVRENFNGLLIDKFTQMCYFYILFIFLDSSY